MKLCAKFFLILLLVTLISTSAYALDPKVRNAMLENQAKSFDHVEKLTTVSVTATTVVTPTDAVSTNTAAVYYLPDDFNYPISLEIQNHSAASLSYNIYSTAVGTGVDVPDANDAVLLDDNGAVCASEKSKTILFYQAPNLSFASTGTASVTFIVRSIKGEE